MGQGLHGVFESVPINIDQTLVVHVCPSIVGKDANIHFELMNLPNSYAMYS
jgi:hypothetical protein